MLEILQRVPFKHWKAAKRWVRDNYAMTSWPDRPSIALAISADVLEEQLRRHHFEDASGWSLKYEGEILNMRRPAGVGSDGTPLEDHLRARKHGSAALEINAHAEANRWEAKTAHVHEEGLAWLDEAELRVLLEGCGVDVERLEA